MQQLRQEVRLCPRPTACLTLFPTESLHRTRRFAAITVRIDKPKCTALLFTSGKLVVTGVKSWYECLLASLTIARSVPAPHVSHDSTCMRLTFLEPD